MTPDEAATLLRDAIIQHARAHDLAEEDELLDEFVIVASWQKVEEDGMNRYSVQTPRMPSTPQHVYVGLLRYGEHLVTHDDD